MRKSIRRIVLFASMIVTWLLVIKLFQLAITSKRTADILARISEVEISDLPPLWFYGSIIGSALILMAFIWWILQVIPKRQARGLQKPESLIVLGEQKLNIDGFTHSPQSSVKPTELFSIENEARKTLSQIIGGFIVIVSLILTGANLVITSRLTESGQITDRFTKAVTQLGDPKLEVRLGGIYALERIAKDSKRDHWSIMEILTAYVREKAKQNIESSPQKIQMKKSGSKGARNPKTPLPSVDTDIQAILTVIGRRNVSSDKGRLDLINTALSEADLSGANLIRAFLSGANLSGAFLSGALLSGANLSGANLSRADLSRADLSGANLITADLSRAFLIGGNLREAFLITANLSEAFLSEAFLIRADLSGAFLIRADLSRADLSGADLTGADLSGADLTGADLSGADLSRADLSRAKNLRWEQVSKAIIDKNTKLPPDLETKRNKK